MENENVPYNNLLVSIITVCYNSANTIAKNIIEIFISEIPSIIPMAIPVKAE